MTPISSELTFTKSGLISHSVGTSWFGVVGDLDSKIPPLVLLHGGPGFTSYCLEPLARLAHESSGGVPVVFIDQAGCGRSRSGGKRRDMSIAGFVKELRAIVDGLAIERCHLFGHSFGGVIVGEFALAYPAEVASVVFASCSIDIPRWLNDAERLRGTLPLLSRMVLREGERTGDYTSPQYLQALGEYYERFVYRFREKPNCIAQSERESDSETYTTVWGPNELVVSGVAQGYDLTPRLKEISCPLLFTCGRFDEATPEAHQYFASLVTGASCIVFEESAHHPQLNEETLFLDTIRSFVRS